MIYSGETDESDRIGSNIDCLLDYLLRKKGDKPVDADLFREMLIYELKIPAGMLHKREWKLMK